MGEHSLKLQAPYAIFSIGDTCLNHAVPEDDAWFYTPQWQERLARAKDDIVEGRTKTFSSVEEMLADLEPER